MSLRKKLTNNFLCQELARATRILTRSPKHLYSTLGLVSLLACGGGEIVQPPPPDPTEPPKDTTITFNSFSPSGACAEKFFYQSKVDATSADGAPVALQVLEPSWLQVSNNVVYGYCPVVSKDSSVTAKIKAYTQNSSKEQPWNINVQNVPEVNVLTQSQASDITSLQDNSISFSQPVNYAVGDFIISEVTTNTPDGMFRKAASISQDRKTVTTDQASLEEVVKNGKFSSHRTISPSGASMIPFLPGVSMSPANPNFDFGANLNNVVLYDKDGNPATTGDRVIANGSMSFSLSYDLSSEYKNSILTNFSFENTTSESLDLTVGSNVIGLAVLKEIKIAEYNLPSVTIGYIPVGGVPIPVTVKPKLEVNIVIKPTLVNPLAVRVKQDATLNTSITYDGARWSSSGNFSSPPIFDFTNPIVSNEWDLSVSGGPTGKILLYGFAGPSFGVNGTLRLEYKNNLWKLYGGLEAMLGASMEIFSHKIGAFAEKVLGFEKLLAESPPIQPVTLGDFLITSTRDGNAEVYTMKIDGSGQVNVTKNPAQDYEAALSSDKSKMVFVSERDGNPEVYTLRFSDGTTTRLTQSPGVDRMPAWSPDGLNIAFYSNRNGAGEIFLMSPDGTNQRRLNLPTGNHGQPRWCSNQSLVFSSTMSTGNFDIYKVNIDNAGASQRLTTNTGADAEPSCSPDGSKIAFISNRQNGLYYDIWTMDSNGGNQVNRSNTTIGTDDYAPSWSPDGVILVYAFGHIDRTASNIWKMGSDGANKTQITTTVTGSSNTTPFWAR